MKPGTAQRIRFGILAARHAWERERLTPWQEDALENPPRHTALGVEAYRRETIHAKARHMVKRWL